MDLNYFLETCTTQQSLAFTFNAKHNEQFKYCKKYFYYFDDESALWREVDKTFIISKLSSWMIAQQDKFIATKQYKDQNELFNLTRIITQQTKYNYLESVINFLIPEITDNTLFEKLDRAHPYLLPIRNNKIIDLRTGESRLRLKEDYFTYFCDVEPTEDESEVFENFISQLMCNNKDNIKYLQKILGYCISGDTKAQTFFIFWGKGSNGKSLLLKLLDKLLGKAYKPASKQIFISSNKSGGAETIDIKDARLVSYSETSNKDKLNEELIKMITGEDKITARGLYKDPITFSLIAKLILCTNHKPEFNGNDGAMIRRIKFVPFLARFCDKPTKENEFKKDESLGDKLINNYMNEFFSFCLKGAIEYYKNKSFNPPSIIEKEQNKYIETQATVESFFNEKIIADENELIPRSELYENYKSFCEELDLTAVNKSQFLDKISDFLGEPTRHKKFNYIYRGFRFVDASDSEEDKKKNNLDL